MPLPCAEPTCPLCASEHPGAFFKDTTRTYRRCGRCQLVFVPKRYWLSPAQEKATYDLHENDADHPGYRQFLSRLSTPLLARLDSNQTGLDFGCGPGPALAALLEKRGHTVALFDPHYVNNPLVFDQTYDFICATEVVEHLHDPNKEWATLFKLLRPGGWLGIMTKLVIDQRAFSQWHYIRDRTHICFYSRSTFEYLARRFKAELSFVENDVILLNKSNVAARSTAGG
jgi:SAM-dependent methyltransferase